MVWIVCAGQSKLSLTGNKLVLSNMLTPVLGSCKKDTSTPARIWVHQLVCTVSKQLLRMFEWQQKLSVEGPALHSPQGHGVQPLTAWAGPSFLLHKGQLHLSHHPEEGIACMRKGWVHL